MKQLIGRIARFGIVGAVNTGVHFVVYLAVQTVLPYMVAHLLAFAVAMVGSYFLNCRFTFRVKPTLRGFLLFPLSNLTNLAVSTAGLYVLVEFFGVPQWVAPLPTAALAIPITFLVAQFVLVGRGSKRSDDERPAAQEVAQ